MQTLKCNISSKINTYINSKPMIHDEYLKNGIFKFCMDRVLECDTDDEAIKHIVEIIYNASSMYTDVFYELNDDRSSN